MTPLRTSITILTEYAPSTSYGPLDLVLGLIISCAFELFLGYATSSHKFTKPPRVYLRLSFQDTPLEPGGEMPGLTTSFTYPPR